MDRVNAADMYYFDENYFLNFIDNNEYKTDIIFALLKDTHKIISAAMMIKTNNKIIQYHISGTLNDYLNLTPIRLLIDEMRIIGTREGYKYFNLGGGLGSQEDSLFQFKASFSKDFKKFKVWKYIVNEQIYEQLCNNNTYLSNNENITYFPLYRYSN
jgi:lipid II:glycine glycyltransferase (peptidoglycan interpeptide bridge formation enzyme)